MINNKIPTITIIAATSSNKVIGNKGRIPWHLPEDLKHFKEMTIGHPIIMGRKTFESLGKPLKSRKNIVVTHNKLFKAKDVDVVHSIQQALDLCKDQNNVYVIGGEQIYKEAFPLADRLKLTIIEKTFDGDTFFPDIGKEFKEYNRSEIFYSKKQRLSYYFLEMVRVNSFKRIEELELRVRSLERSITIKNKIIVQLRELLDNMTGY